MKELNRLCKSLLEAVPALVALVGTRIGYSEDPDVRVVPCVAYELGDRRPAPYGLRNFYIYPLTIRYLDNIDAMHNCFNMLDAISTAFTNFAGLTSLGQHVKWINFISGGVHKYTESKLEAEIMLEVHANL